MNEMFGDFGDPDVAHQLETHQRPILGAMMAAVKDDYEQMVNHINTLIEAGPGPAVLATAVWTGPVVEEIRNGMKLEGMALIESPEGDTAVAAQSEDAPTPVKQCFIMLNAMAAVDTTEPIIAAFKECSLNGQDDPTEGVGALMMVALMTAAQVTKYLFSKVNSENRQCPWCNVTGPMTVAWGVAVGPTAKDMMVCNSCFNPSLFDGDSELRRPNVEEMQELNEGPAFTKVVDILLGKKHD